MALANDRTDTKVTLVHDVKEEETNKNVSKRRVRKVYTENELSFLCEYCNRGYASDHARNQHIRLKHVGTAPQSRPRTRIVYLPKNAAIVYSAITPNTLRPLASATYVYGGQPEYRRFGQANSVAKRLISSIKCNRGQPQHVRASMLSQAMPWRQTVHQFTAKKPMSTSTKTVVGTKEDVTTSNVNSATSITTLSHEENDLESKSRPTASEESSHTDRKVGERSRVSVTKKRNYIVPDIGRSFSSGNSSGSAVTAKPSPVIGKKGSRVQQLGSKLLGACDSAKKLQDRDEDESFTISEKAPISDTHNKVTRVHSYTQKVGPRKSISEHNKEKSSKGRKQSAASTRTDAHSLVVKSLLAQEKHNGHKERSTLSDRADESPTDLRAQKSACAYALDSISSPKLNCEDRECKKLLAAKNVSYDEAIEMQTSQAEDGEEMDERTSSDNETGLRDCNRNIDQFQTAKSDDSSSMRNFLEYSTGSTGTGHAGSSEENNVNEQSLEMDTSGSDRQNPEMETSGSDSGGSESGNNMGDSDTGSDTTTDNAMITKNGQMAQRNNDGVATDTSSMSITVNSSQSSEGGTTDQTKNNMQSEDGKRLGSADATINSSEINDSEYEFGLELYAGLLRADAASFITEYPYKVKLEMEISGSDGASDSGTTPVEPDSGNSAQHNADGVSTRQPQSQSVDRSDVKGNEGTDNIGYFLLNMETTNDFNETDIDLDIFETLAQSLPRCTSAARQRPKPQRLAAPEARSRRANANAGMGQSRPSPSPVLEHPSMTDKCIWEVSTLEARNGKPVFHSMHKAIRGRVSSGAETESTSATTPYSDSSQLNATDSGNGSAYHSTQVYDIEHSKHQHPHHQRKRRGLREQGAGTCDMASASMSQTQRSHVHTQFDTSMMNTRKSTPQEATGRLSSGPGCCDGACFPALNEYGVQMFASGNAIGRVRNNCSQWPQSGDYIPHTLDTTVRKSKGAHTNTNINFDGTYNPRMVGKTNFASNSSYNNARRSDPMNTGAQEDCYNPNTDPNRDSRFNHAYAYSAGGQNRSSSFGPGTGSSPLECTCCRSCSKQAVEVYVSSCDGQSAPDTDAHGAQVSHTGSARSASGLPVPDAYYLDTEQIQIMSEAQSRNKQEQNEDARLRPSVSGSDPMHSDYLRDIINLVPEAQGDVRACTRESDMDLEKHRGSYAVVDTMTPVRGLASWDGNTTGVSQTPSFNPRTYTNFDASAYPDEVYRLMMDSTYTDESAIGDTNLLTNFVDDELAKGTGAPRSENPATITKELLSFLDHLLSDSNPTQHLVTEAGEGRRPQPRGSGSLNEAQNVFVNSTTGTNCTRNAERDDRQPDRPTKGRSDRSSQTEDNRMRALRDCGEQFLSTNLGRVQQCGSVETSRGDVGAVDDETLTSGESDTTDSKLGRMNDTHFRTNPKRAGYANNHKQYPCNNTGHHNTAHGTQAYSQALQQHGHHVGDKHRHGVKYNSSTNHRCSNTN
ncbi:hypothetical protein SARC_12091 [Sphaeroforma arctica JP610]|uniref:C2H2-type domain-containing protein n=1 Tax=Sphaeroforma arctica JP610 TaxID=667725 RepID=A0A0L0FF27_9EUKA|nr:hypothetical protein SARC_12091 [Sphaeroforma arctica JP610]KNC75382.1 hypothetical protein SARC_12091 [Sphaeroforma arctica JP610]|eukprot:XP_014149284.1 hypothetical protein SARC_12091 [Sphaeroforma arctica JP610]